MNKPLKSSQQEKYLRTLIQAAVCSGDVLMKYFPKNGRSRSDEKKLNVREKKGAGLVTEADFHSEKAALSLLKKIEPSFELLTEETAPDYEPGHRPPGRWIIDPLDGTTNFVHGFGMFSVSIACEVEGKIECGVVYHPWVNELYFAKRGHGCFLMSPRLETKKTRLEVSRTQKMKDSLLTTGFTYRKDQGLRAEMVAFEELSRVARAIRRPGSAALDLALTARGVFDGFWERRLSPWDVAAGSLLVSEAGGRVSDFSGKPFEIDSDQLLASNGLLHRQLLRAIHSN